MTNLEYYKNKLIEQIKEYGEMEMANILKDSYKCLQCPIKRKCEYKNTSCYEVWLDFMNEKRTENE